MGDPWEWSLSLPGSDVGCIGNHPAPKCNPEPILGACLRPLYRGYIVRLVFDYKYIGNDGPQMFASYYGSAWEGKTVRETHGNPVAH